MRIAGSPIRGDPTLSSFFFNIDFKIFVISVLCHVKSTIVVSLGWISIKEGRILES